MKLSQIIELLGLEQYTKPAGDTEAVRGYCSDMLSDVIANAEKDSVWLTMQTHVNVVAVAALKDLAAVIITGGHKPADETLEIAGAKGVCILGTSLPAFETAGKLYAAGLSGGPA